MRLQLARALKKSIAPIRPFSPFKSTLRASFGIHCIHRTLSTRNGAEKPDEANLTHPEYSTSKTQRAQSDGESDRFGASPFTHLERKEHRPLIPSRWFRHPYSVPTAPSFFGLSKTQTRAQAKEMESEEYPEASWYAQSATRPLLLTLDAFDTVFTPRDPVPRQYCEVAARWGFELSELEVQQSFKKIFKSLSKQYPNYGKDKDMHYQAWWARLIKETLTPLLPETHQVAGVPDDLIEALYTQFSSDRGYKLFQDVLPFLAMLGTSYQARRWAPRRTMLGVLSNSDPRVREILSSFGVDIAPEMFPPRFTPPSRFRADNTAQAKFAFATLSYECGHAKPSRMIFDAAIRDAQKALDSMNSVNTLVRSGLHVLGDMRQEFHLLHVGDDVEKDIIPALTCGWDAILLDRNQEDLISVRDIGDHKVTVVNNLIALRRVITKDRLEMENGTPRQAPVWIDESRPIPTAAKEK